MATIKIDKVRKCFGNVEVLKEFRKMFCSDDVCEAKKELAGRDIPVGLK